MLLINHDTRRHSNEPIISWRWCVPRVTVRRENACEQVTWFVWGFLLIGWEKGTKSNNPLVTSEKNFPRIPQKRIDYFNEGKNYVVYKSINNIMGVAGNRIRHEHITSQTTVSGIQVHAAIEVPCGLNALPHASFGCHAAVKFFKLSLQSLHTVVPKYRVGHVICLPRCTNHACWQECGSNFLNLELDPFPESITDSERKVTKLK